MKFIRKKRGTEVNQQIIMTVLMVIFIVVLLVFFVKSCNMIKEKNRSVILSDLENGIRGLVELLSSKQGAIRQDSFEVPDGIDMVCFVDLSKSQIIIDKTQLVKDYPMINDSLKTENHTNVFLIDNKEVVHSFYGGDICFDNYPFYSCTIVHDNTLDIWFEGRKGCTTLYINWSMFPDNYRNDIFYLENPLFLIKEIDQGINIDNWREILSIVPLSLFRQRDVNQVYQNYTYNYSVVYKISGELLTHEVEELMDEYSTNKAYIFDHSVISPPIDKQLTFLSTTSQEYFDFWSDYSSVILVDYDNEQSALIASLLAAYVNAPLIFINEDNLENFDDEVIFGRRVFIVSSSVVSLDDATYDYVRDYSSFYYEIQDSLLGIEGSVPAFAKLYSDITIK